ncbi:MAG: PAS domain-containing protein [Alphaproteobacteria bacterium]|nr:PAS domain-containing protein [Alphaproteobacteria bacterium]
MNSLTSKLGPTSSSFGDSALLTDVQGESEAYEILVAERLADAGVVFQLAYSYWNALRGDRAMCSRAEIDPIELRDVLTHLIILDVVRDPFDGIVRLAGSDVEKSVGFPLTNLALSQIWDSRETFIMSEYERLAAGTKPRYSVNKCENAWQAHKKVSRLLCPLSTDGVTVDAILGAVIFEKANL